MTGMEIGLTLVCVGWAFVLVVVIDRMFTKLGV